MANNLTLFGDGEKLSLTKPKEMAAALKSSAADGATSQLPEGGVYISFSGKKGVYSIGQEKDDADPDEIWLVNIYNIIKGWMCWKGGQPAAKRMASIYAEPVPVPDMSEHGPFNEARGEGWFKAKGFMLRSLDTGTQGLFTTNTKSAVNEVSKLEEAIADRMSEGLPCWPIVTLQKEEFTAQGQKNYKPVFKVYGWIGDDQIAEMTEMESIEEVYDEIDRLISEAAKVKGAVEDEGDTALDAPDEDEDEKPRKRERAEKKEKTEKVRRRNRANV